MTDTENISLEIVEASENLILPKDTLPQYFKYRYTFPKDYSLEDQIKLARDIVALLKKRYTSDPRLTAGIEHYTKGMLGAKPHLHVHFISKHPSNTIRKGLAQEFRFIGRCQGCIPEVLVDEDKFFRYPLKQQKGETKRLCLFNQFTKEEILIMIDVAHAIWMQSAEVSIGKLEKKIERSSEDRLFQYLDRYFEIENPTTLTQVISTSVMYFVEHEPCFNFTTIQGYTEKYLLSRKKISIKKYLEIKGTQDFKL